MTADGKSVDKEILLGKRGNSPTPSRKAYQWPNIPEPTQEECQLWKSALLLLYDITENCTTLKSNHWRWFSYSSRQYSAWNRSQDGKMYQKLKKNWKIWEITDQSRTRSGHYYKETEARCTSLGQGQLIPITIKYIGENTIKIVSSGRYDVQPYGHTLEESPWFCTI